MNQNQLTKCFGKSKTYYFAEEYAKLLKEARMVKVSFRDLSNVKALSEQYNEAIKSTTISLPFGNILFNIHDYPMMSMQTGEVEKREFTVHIIPAIITFKEHNLITMVITDIRVDDKTPTTRSYVVYADMSGMHVMTAVDKASAAAGCTCFKQNVFSNDPGIALQFLTRTPGFVHDAGLALPDCSGSFNGCAPIIACKTEISDLIKLILAYCNLPTNMFVRVLRKEGKYRDRYYIIADSAQWERIKTGDVEAELYGNQFTDGSNLIEVMKQQKTEVPNEEIKLGTKVYTPAIRSEDDEAGTVSADGQEGDGGDGQALGSDIPQDAP